MAEVERIALGSGKLYVMEATGTTIPEDAVIEVVGNMLGDISGGASLEYKPEFYTATDDLGLKSRTKVIKEEVTLKSGVMSWQSSTLKKLCATAIVKVDTVKKRTTIKIGGIANNDDKQYIIRFVNKDDLYGDARITIIGQNQSGFTLAFAKDKETIIDAEFKALPNDAVGTLIIIDLDDKPTV